MKLPMKKASSRSRSLFNDVVEGLEAFDSERRGKLTLRRYVITEREIPSITPLELVELRRELRLSRPVFASYLRTKTRTLENWEQGRAKPNAQATLLILLVKRFPDTINRLGAL